MEAHEGPFEGVPLWLHAPLRDWIQLVFSSVYRSEDVDGYVKTMELLFRFTSPLTREGWNRLEELLDRCGTDPVLFLDVLDFILFKTALVSESTADLLEELLNSGGSVWTVVGSVADSWRLETRVSSAARQAFDDASSSGSRAAHRLSGAWTAAFGRHPDPTSSYVDSIRAVEASMMPVVCPKQKGATLGQILGQIRGNRVQFGFRIAPAAPKGDPFDPLDMVLALGDVLKQGQVERHSSGGDGPGPSNTIEQARDAVHLAVLLVEWTDSGAFFRR